MLLNGYLFMKPLNSSNFGCMSNIYSKMVKHDDVIKITFSVGWAQPLITKLVRLIMMKRV